MLKGQVEDLRCCPNISEQDQKEFNDDSLNYQDVTLLFWYLQSQTYVKQP